MALASSRSLAPGFGVSWVFRVTGQGVKGLGLRVKDQGLRFEGLGFRV